ncbi:MAG: hypothetical protein JSV96_11470 [Candidatus Aminicenantes bacterium]|nr:MAG: hypothetical protein JSV96_11470 [Candidatus Aminicenantes bacterium]
MRKFKFLGIAIIFALFSFVMCAQVSTGPKASSTKEEDMLSFIPKDISVIFFINFQRIVTIEAVDKLIKEQINNEMFEKFTDYQKFIEATGIDPLRDILFIAAGSTGKLEEDQEEGFGIINLKYKKDTLLSWIKENTEEEENLMEEDYNGLTIYTIKEKDEEVSIVFINDSNIVAGNKSEVQTVVDVIQKKKENIYKSEVFSPLLEHTNKKALLWGGVIIPPESIKKISAKHPILSVIESVGAISICLDYRDKNIIIDQKLMSSDEAKNHEIANSLSQLKAMGAVIQIQDFNLGDILNRIKISSRRDYVRIYASFPEDLPKNLIDKFTKKEKKKKEH